MTLTLTLALALSLAHCQNFEARLETVIVTEANCAPGSMADRPAGVQLRQQQRLPQQRRQLPNASLGVRAGRLDTRLQSLPTLEPKPRPSRSLRTLQIPAEDWSARQCSDP